MLSIIFSLICSVSVGVLLKIAKNHKVVLMQIIAWNYVIALLLTQMIFTPDWKSLSVSDFPIAVLSSLWILLPVVFLFQALSLKYVGIVKTDIAQRLSLFIPILASYFLFGETFSDYKIIGLIVAFVAIFFTLNKAEQSNIKESPKWQYPLLVLIGFGVIDVLFKKVAAFTAVPYTTSLTVMFSGALIVTWGINFYQILSKKEVFQTSNIGWGVALGLLNFGNIYFYLKAHQELSENPSTVFATMNLGVIILGSLIGVFLFKEKLNKKNYFGIALALVAVVLIMISQLKA
jgi:drug/metabolite transporter (DMT)-like permease